MKRFDVLVIGSGMGGMCTAARLADKGYSVLVIESRSRIGGRCSTRRRDGFSLTTGVVGIERGGIVEDFFRSLGLPFDVRSAGTPGYLIDGVPADLPTGGGLKQLLAAAGGDLAGIERLMTAFSRGGSWQPPSSDLTLGQWVRQYTHDRRLVNVFQTLAAGPLMVNMEEISAGAFFAFFDNLKQVPRFGFAPGGAIALPSALEGHLLKNGGEVWTGAEARRIRIENGAARGALIHHLGRDRELEASVVVSNIGPQNTARLAGRENLDLDELRILDWRVRPARALCLQLAADRPLFDHSHLWVVGSRRVRRLCQPTLVCPELAPAGRHLLVAQATVPDSRRHIDLETETAACLEELEKLSPGFRGRTEVLAVDAYHGGRPAMHARPGLDAPTRTSIVNLYNVGDGVKPPGLTGLPAVVAAADACARDIRRRINLINSAAAAS